MSLQKKLREKVTGCQQSILFSCNSLCTPTEFLLNGPLKSQGDAALYSKSALVSLFSMNLYVGASLVVQWLSLWAPSAGGLGLSPGQGTRSHTLQPRPGPTKATSVWLHAEFYNMLIPYLVPFGKAWIYMHAGGSRIHTVQNIYEVPISQKSTGIHRFMLCINVQNINNITFSPK